MCPFLCKDPDPRLADFTHDDIYTAARRLIHPRIPHVFPSYLGGKLEDVARAETVLANLRLEYKNYEPIEMSEEIFHWLDFFANRLAETKEDIITQKTKKEQDARHKEQEDKNNRADRLLRKLKEQ